jgi:hypothetical protein
MIPAAIITALGLGWLFYMVATAPLGYEDANGFHEGEPCSDYDNEQLSGAGVTPGSPQRPHHRCGRYLGE